ncbi:hypothetical protein OSB04_001078 [Centaurea solstitialis]|uniref:Uncharacterized protein n=1 Tax=Centaurea solstitialis TaxID=347529 RepID=A0AA38WL44_9ASTR|nr:hypothetical protein OSB04_001078 [Centaurea solstitialis]
MIGRRFISFFRRNPIPSSSSSAKAVAEDEAKPKAWGRRIFSGGLICVTGGVALSALDDLVIYHGCSRGGGGVGYGSGGGGVGYSTDDIETLLRKHWLMQFGLPSLGSLVRVASVVLQKIEKAARVTCIRKCLSIFIAISFIILALSSALVAFIFIFSKAMEKASKNQAVIDAIGEPIARGPWYNASLAVTHKRHSVSCTFPVSGPQGTGIFQLRAVRGAEESWLSFFRPRDWEILIMEALLHVPENEEKKRTFRIRISDDISPPACQPCVTGCTRTQEPDVPKKTNPQAS